MSWSGDFNDSEEMDENPTNEKILDLFDIGEKASSTMLSLRYYAFSHGLDMYTSSDATINLIDMVGSNEFQ